MQRTDTLIGNAMTLPSLAPRDPEHCSVYAQAYATQPLRDARAVTRENKSLKLCKGGRQPAVYQRVPRQAAATQPTISFFADVLTRYGYGRGAHPGRRASGRASGGVHLLVGASGRPSETQRPV